MFEENLLVLKALFSDDVFLSFRSIEIDWQFNTLGLVHSKGKVRLLLQILKLKSLQVLLGESLSVELSSGSWRIAFLHRRSHERLLLATKEGVSLTDFVTYNELFMLFNY